VFTRLSVKKIHAKSLVNDDEIETFPRALSNFASQDNNFLLVSQEAAQFLSSRAFGQGKPNRRIGQSNYAVGKLSSAGKFLFFMDAELLHGKYKNKEFPNRFKKKLGTGYH
jgi:uncharacterized UBP type Zn finger protein